MECKGGQGLVLRQRLPNVDLKSRFISLKKLFITTSDHFTIAKTFLEKSARFSVEMKTKTRALIGPLGIYAGKCKIDLFLESFLC